MILLKKVINKDYRSCIFFCIRSGSEKIRIFPWWEPDQWRSCIFFSYQSQIQKYPVFFLRLILIRINPVISGSGKGSQIVKDLILLDIYYEIFLVKLVCARRAAEGHLKFYLEEIMNTNKKKRSICEFFSRKLEF
mgnify:CR=1 FL=1